jgi:hypothetical protein
MRIAALALLLPFMAACAGQGAIGLGGPAVSGNQLGGKVPYGEGSMAPAMNAMNAHCAQFGKKAEIIEMKPGNEGGILEFECHSRKI